ncbi:MAG: hypothetical protein OWU84_15285 [Firmicutes bacterium]|nr:hypothetical protein [Bacillota bacterium]
MHVLLSLALVSSAGNSAQPWQLGASGYAVAKTQADLGMLGYDVGPVTGVMNERTLSQAARFEAAFGVSPGALDARLATTVRSMGAVTGPLQGPVVLALESDLAQLGLYAGPYATRETPALSQALEQARQNLGLPATASISGTLLSAIAEATAIRVTARHDWTYRAQPGDTLSFLAWAAGLPLAGFERANPSPGNRVQVGQLIRWEVLAPPPVVPKKTKTTPPASRTQKSSPSRPISTSTLPPVTGVLANLKPVSDLVVMNPTSKEASALIAAEDSSHEAVDVDVAGEWAVTHPQLMNALKALGNEIAISGYTGANLDALPRWGIAQELSWAQRAVAAEVGTPPTYLILAHRPTPSVRALASRDNLIIMTPSVVILSSHSTRRTTAQVAAALLTHPNQIVVVNAPVRWRELFRELRRHHFVFETLGQVWASE